METLGFPLALSTLSYCLAAGKRGFVLEQRIRFCTSRDGTRIAYSTIGSGPPLVKAATWLGHLQFEFDSPVLRHWSRELKVSLVHSIRRSWMRPLRSRSSILHVRELDRGSGSGR